ncbi:MAG: hypothetical protein JO186_04675 [Actinobacteria bacterium]|nr:hypothetical protein [Actinomycetota bacterium]MBV8396045.1 hypothetical protein [Actinomycetota bacterium]MBV8597795.1 hypothetical protein [Actinomycetota bacterium]
MSANEDRLAELNAKLARIEGELGTAERSLAAVLADLQGWDDDLERLQASVVEDAWRARAEAEAAIAAVRSRRIALERHTHELERREK